MDSWLDERGLSRRGVLVTAAGVTLGATGLTACGGDGGSSTGYGPADPGTTSEAGASESAEAPAGDGAGGQELVQLADVPVGGAVAAENAAGDPVIVSRPTEGEVVAFSAVCTHRGCTVAPQDRILACPCHGSTFDLATGENTGGPAPKPLPRLRVSVVDGAVVEA
jgi:Rieske Fe-S protein